MVQFKQKFKFTKFLFLTSFKINTIIACFPGLSLPYDYNYAPSFNHYSTSGVDNDLPYVAAAAVKSRMAPRVSFDHNEDQSFSKVNVFQETKCKKTFLKNRLICATSFQQQTPSTETECEKLCVENIFIRCQSFEFDNLKMTCSLFNIIPSIPKGNDYDLMSVQNTDETGSKYEYNSNSYKRIRRFVPLHGSSINDDVATNLKTLFKMPDTSKINNCVPALIPDFDRTFVIIDSECYKNQNSKKLLQPFFQPYSSLDTKNNLLSTVNSIPTLNSNLSSSLENNFLQKQYTNELNLQQSLQPFKANIEESECTDGTRAKMQVIDGITVLKPQPILKLQLKNSDECLRACKLNLYNGNLFNKICRAAVFDRSNNFCEIFTETITPNGNLEYIPNLNSIYFEKFCLPQLEFTTNCDEPIYRIPQHTLDSRASGTGAVLTTKSQIDCINFCLTALSKLGFYCSSISYFFDWNTKNCYISRFTKLNRPDLYVADRKNLVDYLEFPKCMINEQNFNYKTSKIFNDQKNNENEWSEWSECNLETQTKTRHRNCSKKFCNSEKEISYCINNEIPKKNIDRKDLKINKCDPYKKCCSKKNELKKLIHGCSVGYRILEDGSHESCIPDDCL